MHLQSLKLTNVRQFDHRSFEFRPGFNLLVGENGAGKTTILRGLLAALGGTRQMGKLSRLEDDDIRLLAHHAEVRAMIYFTNDRVEEFEFRKTLWEPAKRRSRRENLPLILLYSSNEATCSSMKMRRARRIRDADSAPFRYDEEFLYSLERGRFQESTATSDGLFGNSRSVREFVGRVLSTFSSNMDEFYWRFEPYECTLVPPESSEKNSPLSKELQKQARAFAMRKFQESWSRRRGRPFDWPDQTKVVLTPGVPERKRGAGDLPNLREIWDGMRIPSGIAREFLLSCSLEVKLAPRIIIKRRIGTLTLNQLSDGEQRLFSLFVDIARQLLINNRNAIHGGDEAIVLIDEIDVHLHPKWQRRIVPALEDLFPRCQFIATTHSPFVIQATPRQRITSIEPNLSTSFLGGGNSIEDIAEYIQGVSVPQRGIRAEILSSAAKRYFTLLEMKAIDAQQVTPDELRAAEQSYREASEPFTSDSAVHALLKVLMMEGKDQ